MCVFVDVKPFPATKNNKYECFQGAIQISHIINGSVYLPAFVSVKVLFEDGDGWTDKSNAIFITKLYQYL